MYQKKILKKGLRLLTIPIKGTNVVTLLILVKTGSRNEKESVAGISHFAEHMFFKGTKNRSTQIKIATEIDGVGGEMNAFTSKEFTGFYIKISKKHLELAIDVLADILQNSLISPTEIKKEKGVILQEMNMYQDTPVQYVQSLFEQVMYPDHPLGRDVIGSKETILNLKKKDFEEYIQNMYTIKNIVICVSGAEDKVKIVSSLISKHFQFKPASKVMGYEKIIENQQEPHILVKRQKTEQTHFCMGVRGYHINHPQKYILEVLSTLIGGGMSSRLFEEIREKRGLAYYIKSDTESYQDCGFFVIQAGAEHPKMPGAILVILQELKKITYRPVNINSAQKELKKAQEYLKGKITLNIEDSFALAQLFGIQELLADRVESIDEIFKKIDQVTLKDITKTAQELITDSNLNLAIIGPVKNEDKIRKILKL